MLSTNILLKVALTATMAGLTPTLASPNAHATELNASSKVDLRSEDTRVASLKVTMAEQNTPHTTLMANWFGDTFNSVKQGFDYYHPDNQVHPANTQPDGWGQVGREIFDYGVDKLEKHPLFRPGAEILKGLEYGCDLYQCFTPIRAGD